MAAHSICALFKLTVRAQHTTFSENPSTHIGDIAETFPKWYF